jgi:hypothetical protein
VKILYLAPELIVRGSTIPVGPQAVPDLAGEGDAREPATPAVASAVPLRRGQARHGR